MAWPYQSLFAGLVVSGIENLYLGEHKFLLRVIQAGGCLD